MSVNPPDRYALVVKLADLSLSQAKALLKSSTNPKETLVRISAHASPRIIFWQRDVPYGEDPRDHLPQPWKLAVQAGALVFGHFKNGWDWSTDPKISGEIYAATQTAAWDNARRPTAEEKQQLLAVLEANE